MGCSFSKVKPKNPSKIKNKGSNTERNRINRITPDSMRKLLKKKTFGQENEEQKNIRKSLINYDFQKAVASESQLLQMNQKKIAVQQNKETEENSRRKIKEAKPPSKRQTLNNSKFLSDPITKKKFEMPSVNKNNLYFKTLPKEIKELRFQSLKVQEMEQIKKVVESENRNFLKRKKFRKRNKIVKSYFSRYSQRAINKVKVNFKGPSDLQDMDIIKEEFEENDDEKRRPKLKVGGNLLKPKKIKIPRTKTTYKKREGGVLKVNGEEKYIGDIDFKELRLQKIKCGISRSVEFHRREPLYYLLEEEPTELEKVNRKNYELLEAKKLEEELKKWCEEFTKAQKEFLAKKDEDNSVRDENGRVIAIGERMLVEEHISDTEDSLIDSEFKDAFGFQGSAVSSKSSSLLMRDEDEQHAMRRSNSIYDSVFGLKGL